MQAKKQGGRPTIRKPRKVKNERISAALKGNQRALGNKGGGRKTLYKPEYAALAQKLCDFGATDDEMAQFFEVTERTLNQWKLAHPEFASSLKMSKETSDDRVQRSLYQNAMGGNVTAQIFWLKNRRRNDWRDRHEIDHSGTMTVEGVVEALGKLQAKDLASLEKLLAPVAAAARLAPGAIGSGPAGTAKPKR